MTHATITPHGRHCAVTMTGYSPAHKEAVKALAGAEYIGGAWVVSVLALPTLKGIFDTMTVEPAVVAAYHQAIRRMCDQLLPSAHRKGNKGQHIAELMSLHANGIAAIKAKGYQPPTHRHTEAPGASKSEKSTRTTNTHVSTQPTPVSASQEPIQDDKALTLWLTGAQNAAKAEERKAQIVKARRKANKGNSRKKEDRNAEPVGD
jgi:hypothetical protein